MTVPTRPVPTPVLPDSAPFTPEQRAWLNGFFAGLLTPDGGAVTALSPAESLALMPAPAVPAAPAQDDEEAPWHDPSMLLAERMTLAEGRPLRRRLMAAMAQQDCGQCGYNCQDYADALASGAEARLNLCVPGGKETARMLKTLHGELASGVPGPAEPKPAAPALRETAPGRCREHPVDAVFLSRTRLNREGSEKETWHVEFDLAGTGLDYVPGDSFGVMPANDPALVDAVIAAIDAPPDFPIAGRPLRDVLMRDMSLGLAPDVLFQLLTFVTRGDMRHKAKALASGADPEADRLDVLATLEMFPGIRPDPEAFVECLEPLQPRLYSISSSPKADPGRVSLTVDAVRYRIGARQRLGCASTYLAERVSPGDPVKIYVQKGHGFALPADGATPIVMVGPGTGIAPFRAFLQERMATKAAGKAWLFFGHQRRGCDFFYEDEIAAMQVAGVLTRLSLAWSRDGASKTYVQDRMREEGAELLAWIEQGAHFYVCGDAKRMAADVDRALHEIVAVHGRRDEAGTKAYVAALRQAGRYQTDVY